MLLCLAAFAPELEGLDATFARETVGVGLVEAALGTTRALAKHHPTEVVLLGTAGAYPGSGLAIGAVVVAREVVLAAPSGALVPPMPQRVTCAAGRLGGRAVVVATTLAITTDDGVAAALSRATGADVEHLEAFAVGRACAEAGVAFTAVLGIANAVGSAGRREWQANHVRAAAAAVRSLATPRSPG